MDRVHKMVRALACLIFAIILSGGSGYSQAVSHLTSFSEGIVAPLRIAVDNFSNIYVSDAVNGTVSRYDETGSLIRQITSVESPVSIATDSDGRLFIGDGATGSIYLYDEDNGPVEYYTGTEFPSSMVFGPDNSLYISDSKLQEILVLDVSGRLIQTLGKGIVEYPTGIAYDNSNRRVIVGEHGGGGTGFTPLVKVWVFDLEGNLVNSFGSHGSGDGQFYRIQGLEVGKCGDIYVVDPYQTRVSIFDEDGNFKSSYGEFGTTEGRLNIPMDIAFDTHNRMLVSSLNNGSLELYEISDMLPCAAIKTDSRMICDGESADIEISFTGVAPWIFTYTVDGTSPVEIVTSDNPYILSSDMPGHYEVVSLQDANFTGVCFTGSADILLSDTKPTAHISGDATVCSGESADIIVDFTGSPPWIFSYTIDGENPQSVLTTSNPHILKVTEPGRYVLNSIKGGACNGTIVTGSADINVIESPTSEFESGNDIVLLWPDQTVSLDVILTGTPPWSISYTIDLEDPITITNITESPYAIVDNRPGTYEIIEVSDSRCSSGKEISSYPDVVPISENGLPTSSIISAEYSICEGDYVPIEVSFTGDPPWTFSYTDETTTNTIYRTLENPYIINAESKGVYRVTALRDSRFEGLDFEGEARVSLSADPVADFSFSSDKLDVSFSNLSLNAGSFYWSFGDGSTSALENPIHTFDEPGVYLVSLTAINGTCPDSIIIKTLELTALSNEEVNEDKALLIYPNPSGGQVNIEIGLRPEPGSRLEIFNQLGMKIYTEELEQDRLIISLDLSELPGGWYFVKLISGENIYIEQIVLRDGYPEQ